MDWRLVYSGGKTSSSESSNKTPHPRDTCPCSREESPSPKRKFASYELQKQRKVCTFITTISVCIDAAGSWFTSAASPSRQEVGSRQRLRLHGRKLVHVSGFAFTAGSWFASAASPSRQEVGSRQRLRLHGRKLVRVSGFAFTAELVHVSGFAFTAKP